MLLAGDVSADAAVNIPTCYYDSSAMSQFGGDATIASDNPYADLDGDNVPELAIERIPADSPNN
ncbi:MAG: C25 family cysteine peptidase [Pirellulaceae bacterium]